MELDMIRSLSLAVAAALFAVSAPWATAAEPASVGVGDAAPQFSAKDQTGSEWKSSEHVGKKIMVVYFYPADFTGGCTRQACSFRDDMKQLTDIGVEVVGVSGDTPETHAKFREHHDLNFTLLSDYDGKVAEAFGVPTRAGGSVQFEGETLTRGVTASRWTFVIDGEGKIALKNTSVQAAEDSAQVIEFVKSKLSTDANN